MRYIAVFAILVLHLCSTFGSNLYLFNFNLGCVQHNSSTIYLQAVAGNEVQVYFVDGDMYVNFISFTSSRLNVFIPADSSYSIPWDENNDFCVSAVNPDVDRISCYNTIDYTPNNPCSNPVPPPPPSGYYVEGNPPTSLASTSSCSGCAVCAAPCYQDSQYPRVMLPKALLSLTTCPFPPYNNDKKLLSSSQIPGGIIDISSLVTAQQYKFALQGGNNYFYITNLQYQSEIEFYTCDRSSSTTCAADSKRLSKTTATAIAIYSAQTGSLLALQSACDICSGSADGTYCSYVDFSNTYVGFAQSTSIVVAVYGVKASLIQGTTPGDAGCGLGLPLQTYLYIRRLDSLQPCTITYHCTSNEIDITVRDDGQSYLSNIVVKTDKSCNFPPYYSYYLENGTQIDPYSFTCADAGSSFPSVLTTQAGFEYTNCIAPIKILSTVKLLFTFAFPEWFPNYNNIEERCNYRSECSFRTERYYPEVYVKSSCYSSFESFHFEVQPQLSSVSIGDSFSITVNAWDIAGASDSATSIVYVHGLNLYAISLVDLEKQSSTILELEDNNAGPDHIPLYLSSTYSFQFIFSGFDNNQVVDLLLIPFNFGIISSQTLAEKNAHYYTLSHYTFSTHPTKRDGKISNPAVYSYNITTWNVELQSTLIDDSEIGDYFYLALVSCFSVAEEINTRDEDGDIASAYGFFHTAPTYANGVTLSAGTNILETYATPDSFSSSSSSSTSFSKKRVDTTEQPPPSSYCSEGQLLIVSLSVPIVTINPTITIKS